MLHGACDECKTLRIAVKSVLIANLALFAALGLQQISIKFSDLAMTQADIEAKYWAHYYHINGEKEEYDTDDNFDEKIDSISEIDFSEWEYIINDSV